MVDCAKGRAIAQVATDEPKFIGAALEELRGAECNVVVGSAMETVAADRFLFVKLVRETVEIGVSRQRVMKGCIENSDMRYGGKKPAHFANPGGVDRIVQRRERAESFDLREHFVG